MTVQERLIRYAQVASASDPRSGRKAPPSADREWDMARLLQAEMEELGFTNISLSDTCYLFGEIPSNIPDWDGPVLGFVCHMDVSSEAPFENIRPQIIHYEGGDVLLNQELGIVMKAEEFPVLGQYIGCDLVCTDGTTLLGADNKAAIAEVMTLAEILKNDPSIPHGTIKVGFTPDEEIGWGGIFFDVDKFGADFAYTIDAERFGDFSLETFCAFNADVDIRGAGIHPGLAKDTMVNAIHVAQEFDACFPAAERPEHTCGYEGFYQLHTFNGTVEHADLHYYLRDHDYEKVCHRCDMMRKAAELMNLKYGEGTVTVHLHEMYRNMYDILKATPKVYEIPMAISRSMGAEPHVAPMRGGTDGAVLTLKGLPCPNFGPGCHNLHSRMEFAVVQSMEKAVQMCLNLVTQYAALKKDLS